MKKTLLILAAALLIFAGCGKAINGPLGPVTPSGAGVTQSVGTTGGTVSAGVVSVVIPAGALSGDAAITIAPLSDGALPLAAPLSKSLIAAATFGPAGTLFMTPVTITFALKTSETPGAKIPLFLFNATTNTWDSNGTALVSIDGKTASAAVSHFSTYSAMKASSDDSAVTENLVHNHIQWFLTGYSGYYDFDAGREITGSEFTTGADFHMIATSATGIYFGSNDSGDLSIREITAASFDAVTTIPDTGYTTGLDYNGTDDSQLVGKLIAVKTDGGAKVVLQILAFSTNPEPSWVKIKWKKVK